ncbi:uncharacterized protein PHACADRAFT_253346 [Phanerochaete carnosa HHB-10118-sp]|uniref:Uncharacterized protein n=1 Tax=Phanerochaete carnosa (strain HHB-10118-sp) TaxID=650164 RepID=K5VXL8_PHACS|nr:uncharacterized protein PHACADRAFT_253346 [Phanerochaete carnosa HHB-10118-sp]EKM56293.1 hypothetical protein PHACADRAFT_253346 [Phanerochaete carnosa HHB-10118-sp]
MDDKFERERFLVFALSTITTSPLFIWSRNCICLASAAGLVSPVETPGPRSHRGRQQPDLRAKERTRWR